MSQTTTLILLPETAYQNPGNGAAYTVTGNSQPAAGFYIGRKSLQTVNVKLTDVTGNVAIEATLASTPVDGDWFNVYSLEANAEAPANSAPLLASDANLFTNIEGNFVSIRAVVSDFKNGTINYIKLSY
jgi:hypothetical protein